MFSQILPMVLDGGTKVSHFCLGKLEFPRRGIIALTPFQISLSSMDYDRLRRDYPVRDIYLLPNYCPNSD